MRKTGRVPSGRTRLQERAFNAMRPGVEALLLAAVAMGCAQAGWSALAPHVAYSSDTPKADTFEPGMEEAAQAAVRSPFSPALDGSGSHAATAVLSSVKLAGVRVADDPSRSGCILTLE